MNSSEARIYLDNAATSWPKPESVYAAVENYQRNIGVAAGRGGYRLAEEVGRQIAQLRGNIAKLIDHSSERDANCCVFTFNCTDSLNLALHGLLKRGDHVVTSSAEHNSIFRPLSHLARECDITHTVVPVDAFGVVNCDQVEAAIQPNTRLIAITHASNVTGSLHPIKDIGGIATRHGCLFLVDAAQTLGHVPLNVAENGIDLLAAPGHKGLLGPLGTGILYMREEAARQLRPIRQGGTGTQSEQLDQPSTGPAKFESGNLNVPGLLGLDAGVRYVQQQSLHEIEAQLSSLTAAAIAGLEGLKGVSVYSTVNPCGIVSFGVEGFDPREVASMLDSAAQIQVRAGLHCAPRMHQSLKTFDTGGTVRASFGHFSTQTDVEKFLFVMEQFTQLELS